MNNRIERTLTTLVEHDVDINGLWEQVLEYVQVTPLGLLFRGEPMPIELYGVLCGVVGEVHKSSRWDIGDAIIYGDIHYGEDYLQFVDLFGVAEHTLRQYARVCRRLPYAERAPYQHVPWTALQMTAHLEPETRDNLLEAYAGGELETTDDLRAEVNALRDGPEPDLLPPCPRCAGRLTQRKCQGCGLDFSQTVLWIVDLLKEIDVLKEA